MINVKIITAFFIVVIANMGGIVSAIKISS